MRKQKDYNVKSCNNTQTFENNKSNKFKIIVVGISTSMALLVGGAFSIFKGHKNNQNKIDTKQQIVLHNEKIDTNNKDVRYSIIRDEVVFGMNATGIDYEVYVGLYFEYNSSIFAGGWIDYEDVEFVHVQYKHSGIKNTPSSELDGINVTATVAGDYKGEEYEATLTIMATKDGVAKSRVSRWRVTTGGSPFEEIIHSDNFAW